MVKELGDVMWQAAVLADKLGFSLADVCNINLAKLNKRMDEGKLGGSGDNR